MPHKRPRVEEPKIVKATTADECRRSAEEVQKHVQPHNSQSVGVTDSGAWTHGCPRGWLGGCGLGSAWRARSLLYLAGAFIFLLPSLAFVVLV